MINLAGDKECDITIKEELKLAGIEIVEVGKMDREVPASVIGKCNNFIFKRAWYYWVVEGFMPLEQANYLYDNYKHLEIRVAGNAGNVKPEEWTTSREYQNEINKYAEQLYKKLITFKEYIEICEKLNKGENLCVDHYHIDTQEGLNIFVDTIKKYNIIG